MLIMAGGRVPVTRAIPSHQHFVHLIERRAPGAGACASSSMTTRDRSGQSTGSVGRKTPFSYIPCIAFMPPPRKTLLAPFYCLQAADQKPKWDSGAKPGRLPAVGQRPHFVGAS
jgi:hypothetical protein